MTNDKSKLSATKPAQVGKPELPKFKSPAVFQKPQLGGFSKGKKYPLPTLSRGVR